MDNWIIARYQSLVNLFQYKPTWWIEQCAYVYGLVSIGRLFYRETFDWWAVVIFLLDIVMVMVCLRASKSEAYTERVFGSGNKFIRFFFFSYTAFFCFLNVVIIGLGGSLKPISIISNMGLLAITSCFYFGVCLPPPPPKTSPKMAFEGSNS